MVGSRRHGVALPDQQILIGADADRAPARGTGNDPTRRL
jgi:hypothetical protein